MKMYSEAELQRLFKDSEITPLICQSCGGKVTRYSPLKIYRCQNCRRLGFESDSL